MTMQEFLEKAAAIERQAVAAEAISQKAVAQFLAQTHILAAFLEKGLLDDSDIEGVVRGMEASASTISGISYETRREIENAALELLTKTHRGPWQA